MSSTEKLRTFLAVYRSGSVTNGARQRRISQPAASQQLATLERTLGSPLFTREGGGVRPTARGRELYESVAPALDRLEPVLRGMDGGRAEVEPTSVRIGATTEYFSARVVPALSGVSASISAQFGDDREVMRLLEQGDVDVVLTSQPPGRRQVTAVAVGVERFVLVAASTLAPEQPLGSLAEAGEWLSGRPWVTYSHELPITRRFWQRALGRPFAGDLRLIAPDLRVVAAAVVTGLGASLLPTFVVDDLLERGVVVELVAVSDLVPSQQWFAVTLAPDGGRHDVSEVMSALTGAGHLRQKTRLGVRRCAGRGSVINTRS